MASIAGAGTDWDWLLSFVGAGGPAAAERLRRWEARRSGEQWDRVKEFLRALRHDRLHSLDLGEVEDACGADGRPWNGGHALGSLRPAQGDYRGIRDFSTPFALEYLFHGCLEENGRLPRWPDILRYLFVEHRARYVEPFYERYGLVAGSPETRVGSPHMSALQWRVGNAYYSWLREIHLLTALRRRHGLDVRYHALADAEFKADLVHRDTVVALYVPNGRYRDGSSGRKVTAADVNPGRRVIELRLELRRVFGRPWLVTDEAIGRVADAIAADGGHRA